MSDEARRKSVVGDPPQFLEADAVLLRPARGIKPVAGDRLFRQRAARALREQHIFAAQLHPAREPGLRMAVTADAHVAGRDADDFPLVADEKLGRREAWIDLDSERLGARAEPARDRAKRADIIAVV